MLITYVCAYTYSVIVPFLPCRSTLKNQRLGMNLQQTISSKQILVSTIPIQSLVSN